MKPVNEILSEWLQNAFRKAFPKAVYDISQMNVIPSGKPEYGDYQCNAAMALAYVLGQTPLKIARSVAEKAVLHESIDRLEVAGAGFINIFLKSEWLGRYLDKMQHDTKIGVPNIGNGKVIAIDYSSPNVAKPMHIGHIRSTVIGNALDRIYRFLGYKVIADNHLGDWGTQFGILIMGYRHFVDHEKLKTSPVDEMERIYVLSYEKSLKSKSWHEQCRHELAKLQKGDIENKALFEKFVELSMDEFNRIYKRLGVSFDLVRGESYYRNQLASVVKRLQKDALIQESEGAQVAFLDDEKLPPCIVQKSDGAFNYATTDLATLFGRVAEFKPEMIIYVTDERQQLHFKQIFAIARRAGIRTKLKHVWFGLMRLPEGTFSTREGNVIKLEALLDEAEARALAIVKKTSPQMAPKEQEKVAQAVGIGAVKYMDLSQNLQSLVTFTWDKALTLTGNSAPYLQYSYARIRSVLNKYQEQFSGINYVSFPFQLDKEIERSLAIHIIQFPETVIAASRMFKPNILADYLYSLSTLYNTFYQNVPFLKAPAKVRESRLRLCALVGTILHHGLNLLGIETPEYI